MPSIGVLGWLRAVLRGAVLGLVLIVGLLVLLLIRFVEKPVHGVYRPWTPWITQAVCRAAFVILGLTHRTVGTRMAEPGAVVANHSSWLDIFVLNARKRVYFVAKAEVAGWPGINWLAKATGTVFIRRDRREAESQVDVFRRRLRAGHKLLFFPEGTSTDGRRVLPFKTTLFAAFFAAGAARDDVDPAGDGDLPCAAGRRSAVLWLVGRDGPGAAPGEGAGARRRRERSRWSIIPPMRVADFADRKALARAWKACGAPGLSRRPPDGARACGRGAPPCGERRGDRRRMDPGSIRQDEDRRRRVADRCGAPARGVALPRSGGASARAGFRRGA